MRIALLGPANSIHLQRWAAALAQRGHDLLVVSQHRCDRTLLPERAEVAWLPHDGGLGYFRNAGPLRRLLATWRPDLLNAHYASGYGTTAALGSKVPTLLSVWGSDVYDYPYQGRLQGWWLRRNLRRATAIASTSAAMARQVRRLLPDVGPIAITPFGVDLAQFAPALGVDVAQSAWATGVELAHFAPGTDVDLTHLTPAAGIDEPLTLGIVKSLAPKYGVDLLLRACAGLLEDPALRALAPRLLIVGDGPQRAALEALALELGLAASTSFVGAVPHADVPSWLARLDVYAAPSRLDSESFGVAVIEASACGLPVVVSDAGGLPEVVRDGVTGIVVPRDDVPALQAALRRLLLDPALRRRLGQAGRAHVAAHYDWPRCVDAMERAYADTLARARTP